MIGNKEHYDLLEQFEIDAKTFGDKSFRYSKEVLP